MESQGTFISKYRKCKLSSSLSRNRFHNSSHDLTGSQYMYMVDKAEYFSAIFQKLGQQASHLIKSNPREALVYLSEAQKILEYVASCGMNINKQMIMYILHNQACCYQQLWELQKCSNYLEALIYNISSYFETNTPTPIQQIQELISNRKAEFRYDEIFRGKPFNTRIELSQYHLQFCAINSESGNHSFAKKSARQAIMILRDIFGQLNDLCHMKCLNEKEEFKNPQRANILKIIGGISKFPSEFRISKRRNYIATVKYYIDQWTQRKEQDNSKLIKQTLKKFSIGHIMKIRFLEEGEYNIEKKSGFYSVFPQAYQNNSHRKSHRQSEESLYVDNLNIVNVTHKTLLLAIGFFTFATEIRLSAIELYGNDKEKLKNTEDYKQSEIYTLISMIILLIYAPYDMLLIKHIFTSYTTNYRDLFAENQSIDVLKHQFDSFGFGEFKNEDRSSEMTQIYQKKHGQSEFTDEMKTVNFTMFNTNTRRESHSNMSQGGKPKNIKIHVINQRKRPSSLKFRAKSETVKRYQIPNISLNANNVNIPQGQKTALLKTVQLNKKRSLTSMKIAKIEKNKSKNGKKQTKQIVKQEYFEMKNTQNFKKKAKSPECPLKSPRQLKKIKSEGKLNRMLSPRHKLTKHKKK